MKNVRFESPNIEALQAEGYTCVNMHMHSKFSLDAFTSIPALLARAKSAGIGLAITDHNTIAGSLCAQKTNRCSDHPD